jgi:hypothetical protein
MERCFLTKVWNIYVPDESNLLIIAVGFLFMKLSRVIMVEKEIMNQPFEVKSESLCN